MTLPPPNPPFKITPESIREVFEKLKERFKNDIPRLKYIEATERSLYKLPSFADVKEEFGLFMADILSDPDSPFENPFPSETLEVLGYAKLIDIIGKIGISPPLSSHEVFLIADKMIEEYIESCEPSQLHQGICKFIEIIRNVES